MDNYLDIKSKYDELLNEKELLEKELKNYNYSSIKDKANEKIETIKQNYHSFRKQIDPLLLKIEKLSKGNFKLSFINRVREHYTIDNVSQLIEEQKRTIVSILKIISTSGVSNKALEKLNISLGILKDIEFNFSLLYENYLDKLLSESNIKYKESEKKLMNVLDNIKKYEQIINERKSTIKDELDHFNFINLEVNDDYLKEIVLPISKYETSVDTIIKYWNPLKDKALVLNCDKMNDSVEQNINNLIKSTIIQFLYAYPALDKKIFYCCKTANDEMDRLLGVIGQDGLDDEDDEKSKGLGNSVFYHGIAQIESKDFNREVEEQMIYLRQEAKERAVLFQKENVDNIYEYNSLEDISIKSPILVIMNNFPDGFESCNDLDYLFKEGVNYGIFFMVINNKENVDEYNNIEIDFEKFTKSIYEINDLGIKVNNDNYKVAILENRKIINLIQPLIKIRKENKKKNITYERIGFGKLTKNSLQTPKKISIPVAKNDNEVYSIEFSCAGDSPLAYLLIGAPGTGKSSLIDSMIINGAMTYSPDDVIFYLLDFKDGMLSKPYEGENAIPHVRLIAAENKEEDAAILLNNIRIEKERRNALFNSLGSDIKTIAHYNKKSDKKLPRIIVAIDECYPIFSNAELSKDTEELIRQVRSTGIHFVLASQDLKKMSNVLKFIDGRFCYYVEKEDAREMIDDKYAKLVSSEIPKGSHKAYASSDFGKNCTIIHPAYHCDKSSYYNKLIREKWMPLGYENEMIVVGEKSSLYIEEAIKKENVLLNKNKEYIPFGEDYFNHNQASFHLSEKENHTMYIVGKDEDSLNDILTSVMIGALKNNAQVALIDESNKRNLHYTFNGALTVKSVEKEGYLSVLSDFYEEFNKRNKDKRTKYKPYYLIINMLDNVIDFEENKPFSQAKRNNFDLPSRGRVSIRSSYESLKESSSSETTILGRTTLFEILSKIKKVNDMYVILTFSSVDVFNGHTEKNVLKEFAYKLVQKNVSETIGDLMNNDFRYKMLDGINENIIFVSNDGKYNKVRFYKYDLTNKETLRLIVKTIKEGSYEN